MILSRPAAHADSKELLGGCVEHLDQAHAMARRGGQDHLQDRAPLRLRNERMSLPSTNVRSNA